MYKINTSPHTFLHQKKLAAIKIQAAWKGYKVRSTLIEQNYIPDKRGTHLVWRTKKAFFTACLLSPAEKDKIRLYIKNQSLQNLPTFSSGKIPVYYNQDYVFKKCNNARKRLTRIALAHFVCARKGFDLIENQKAAISGNRKFLVARKIPITHPTIHQQLGFYIEHNKELTSCILQFAEFDLLLPNYIFTERSPLIKFTNLELVPHFDNFSFFKDPTDNKYKMAIVDAESLPTNLITDISEKDLFQKFIELICMFPLHIHDLLHLGKRKGIIFSEEKKKSFIGAKDESLQLFRTIYLNHKKYLQRHNIAPHNPHFKNLEISQKGKVFLAKKVKQLLLEKNETDPILHGFLGKKPKKRLAEFLRNNFDGVMDAVTSFIKQKASSLPVKDYPHLVASRFFIIDPIKENGYITKNNCSSLFKKGISSLQEKRARQLLFFCIMEQFSGREIYLYEPNISKRGIIRYDGVFF